MSIEHLFIGSVTAVVCFVALCIARELGVGKRRGRGYADGICLTCGRPEHRVRGMLVPWWEWHPTRHESVTGWAFVCAPVVALMVWVGVDAAAVAGCGLLWLMALSLLVYAGPREGGE